MIDQENLNLHLEKLKEYTAILKDLRKASFKQVEKDRVLRGAVERYLQLAGECSINVGEIIISGLNLKTAETSREVIDILGEENIIPGEFAFRFANVASFRNILVHDYIKIDLKKIYQYLQEDLSDFDDFARYIAKFIEDQG